MKTRRILLALFIGGFISCTSSCLAAAPDMLRTNWTGFYQEIRFVAFSPDGNFLATGQYNTGDPKAVVLRASDLSGVWVNVLRDGWDCISIAFAADSSLVAFGVTHRAGGLFDVDSAAQLSELSSYNAVAFSPMNTPTVVISAGLNGLEKRLISFGLPESPVAFPGSVQSGVVTTLAFESNGASFWLGNDAGIIQRWQVEPPQLLWQTNFQNNSVSGINLLPDGRQIVTLSSNLNSYNHYYYWTDARLWEVGRSNFLLHITPDFPLFSTTLTVDGKYLFTPLKSWDDPDYDTNHLALWRVLDGRQMVCYDEQLVGVQKVAVAPDGRTFGYGRSDGIVAIARMPLLIDWITRNGNQTILKWQGSSGLYQLQSRTNLVLGSWENVGGATTNTVATNTSSTTLFFRVQSLPNP